jgi:hypothetical protein
MPETSHTLALRPGEMVRVKSLDEIFDTLDGAGALDEMPFMPEMLKYCGQVLTVTKRADKTCGPDMSLRHMHNAVFLSDVRCDGSAHGGCEAACLLYWKEAWLARIDTPAPSNGHGPAPETERFVNEVLEPATRKSEGSEDGIVWSCQATMIPRASTRLRGYDVSQYARDARNWGAGKVVRTLLVESFNRAQKLSQRHLPERLRLRGGRTYPYIAGRRDKAATPAVRLDLQPGDRVRIKSKDEIVETLDRTNHVRGLSFDVEMVKYCGRTATVRSRVNRLIDEMTGEMMDIKSDCIILEGVTCTSDYHRLCTRNIYPYWREAWLEKID